MKPAAERTATDSGSAQRLVLAFLMVGGGGVLLGLQREAGGAFVGTGYTSLAMGALVALVAAVYAATQLVRSGEGVRMPRDGLALLSIVAAFTGAAFLVAGVLVPGGPWMFAQVLLLLFVLARTTVATADGPRVGRGTMVLLGLMLLFRLWITYQGCQNQWSALELEVPLLAGMPWLPYGVRTISLVDFTAAEFGIPETGLVFAHTAVLWAVGFALTAGGLWLRQRSAWEYENDRVHDTISELPPPLASLVERLLPEEEWRDLGLHHLSDRQRRKRISALTEGRLNSQLDFRRAWHAAPLAELALEDEFGRTILASFQETALLPSPSMAAAPTPEPLASADTNENEDPS